MNTLVLTARQREVLDFIRKFKGERQMSPTQREIQSAFSLKSPYGVLRHLQALEKKGFLKISRGVSRGIVLPEAFTAEVVKVPLLGNSTIGAQDAPFHHALDTISVSTQAIGASKFGKLFAVEVRGDSMVGAGIREGDIAILEAREPGPGNIVVARVGNEMTLKRLVNEGGMMLLRAENPNFCDIRPMDDFAVVGVVIGLTRKIE